MRLPLAVAAVALIMLLPAVPAQAAAAPAILITKVYYDSPGSDLRGNASLNGEYVTIKNTTRKAIDLAGWSLRDKTGYQYTFGDDQLLDPGKKLTVRTGQGRSGTSTVYWGRRAYVWNNDADVASIRNRSAKLVDSCSYDSTRADYKNCE
ncbi:lamin tail domain-containing protein [Streptosporangium sp. G11]|uniref:lamin tail domain-containing protein n=1 Tax=Streptosporangium sp. G11 TaxID=3436926 RepID=UPI003EBF34E3